MKKTNSIIGVRFFYQPLERFFEKNKKILKINELYFAG